jgi:hypothetical protein
MENVLREVFSKHWTDIETLVNGQVKTVKALEVPSEELQRLENSLAILGMKPAPAGDSSPDKHYQIEKKQGKAVVRIQPHAMPLFEVGQRSYEGLERASLTKCLESAIERGKASMGFIHGSMAIIVDGMTAAERGATLRPQGEAFRLSVPINDPAVLALPLDVQNKLSGNSAGKPSNRSR